MPANRCYYFKDVRELVHPEIYNAIGEERCWELIPDVVKLFLDTTRYEYGKPIRINDWHLGGTFSYSGVRPADDRKYAFGSRHKNWNTFDLKDWNYDTEALQEFIKSESVRLNIERIENFEHTKTWAHCEFGLVLVEKTIWFNP